MESMNSGLRRPSSVRLSLTVIAAIVALLALVAAGMFQVRNAGATDTVTVNVVLQGYNNDTLDILGNGSASYYAGGWHAITTQNPNNHDIVRVNLAPGTYSFAVVYNGTRDQKSVTIAPSPSAQTVYFHAALVNIELQGHDNDALDIPNNGSASYYAGGWHAITTENWNDHRMVVTQMLPGTYSFAVTYNGTRDQKTYTVLAPNSNNNANAEQTVYFHAALVSVELQAHDNSILNIPDNGSASYYAGGWHAMTEVNPNNHGMVQAEMLPGTYSFAATYNGTRDQKSYTVVETNPNNGDNARQTVYFHTAMVSVEIQAHDNSILDIPNNGSASYYAGGWHAMTRLNPNNHRMVEAEMLPGTYSFAVVYNGTRDQKSYTVIEPNPNDHEHARQTVYFHAALVSVQVKSHDGNTLDIPDNGSASYYAGGWHAMTAVDPSNSGVVQAEMLPGTYSFAAVYNGTREQKSYTVIEPNPNNNANAMQTVEFDTVQVISDYGTATGYYAQGWKAFSSGDELLPGTYTFRFNDGTANSAVTLTTGEGTAHIH